VTVPYGIIGFRSGYAARSVNMVEYKEFTFTCGHCNESFSMELDPEDLVKFQCGMFPMDSIMNYLSKDEKDMIYSNTCSNCWYNLFGTDE